MLIVDSSADHAYIRPMHQRIAIGSDHGGFTHKEELTRYLRGLGHEVIDVGCYSSESYDFPRSAEDVARIVARKGANVGVLIDGAGSPSAMCANKVPGVRASVVHDAFTAKISKEHSDANVICFGAKVVDADTAKTLIELWLRTNFLGGKYQRRIDMVTAIERASSGQAPRRRLVTAADVTLNAALADGPDIILTPLAREQSRTR